MAVLLLVGQENEKPEIIRELLDVENNPCTPQYRYIQLYISIEMNCKIPNKKFQFDCFSLAADFALNLFDVKMEEYSKCTVPSDDLLIESKPWIYDEFTLGRVIGTLQKQWTHFSVKYVHFVHPYILRKLN